MANIIGIVDLTVCVLILIVICLDFGYMISRDIHRPRSNREEES